MMTVVRSRVAVVIVARTRAPVPVAATRSRCRARASVLAFVAAFLAANVGLLATLDYLAPAIRDPEYGRKLAKLAARAAERPGRPVVVVLGSSRAAMGVRPEFPNADPAGPLLFNYAQVGSGPMIAAMTLRRLLADGVTPDAVVLEFWPAFLRGDGEHSETARIDPHRLYPGDAAFVRDYYPNPADTLQTMRLIRYVPCSSHRARLMSQLQPGWLRYDKRQDAAWAKMDPWGWLPSFPTDPPADERRLRHELGRKYFDPLFRDYRIDPRAERAAREIAETCRARGIPLALVWLPESSEFRAAYTPRALAMAGEFLDKYRAEFALPLIDAREWVPDPSIADGFHPTSRGAEILSRKLGPAVRAAFPALRGSP